MRNQADHDDDFMHHIVSSCTTSLAFFENIFFVSTYTFKYERNRASLLSLSLLRA